MPAETSSLWHLTKGSGRSPTRKISDCHGSVVVSDILSGSILGNRREELRDRSVLIATSGQLVAGMAAIDLDGIARRILLCPPDLDRRHLASIVADGEVDTVLTDVAGDAGLPGIRSVFSDGRLTSAGADIERDLATEWVLFTSGTTGQPKMVVHSLASLIGPLADGMTSQAEAVWSTFYDIRRYGGLQILMRALVGGGSMILSCAGEKMADFLARAAAGGVTHISGTPSHWRLALMSPSTNPGPGRMAPGYIRLSGEIADQAILDGLRQAFPDAEVAHAFASTEAGVGFDVRDGRAGFPASVIDADGEARIKVEADTLRIRGSRTASRFLGAAAPPLKDAGGFVDTGDVVARVGDRFHFMGRREGVINVGGQKVHPEEVEAVLNRHPAVEISYVWRRASPITGALVAADVVLRPPSADDPAAIAVIRDELRDACRVALAAHKVPVTIRAVPTLSIAASGKLARVHA